VHVLFRTKSPINKVQCIDEDIWKLSVSASSGTSFIVMRIQGDRLLQLAPDDMAVCWLPIGAQYARCQCRCEQIGLKKEVRNDTDARRACAHRNLQVAAHR
jgi:hypothetical protein